MVTSVHVVVGSSVTGKTATFGGIAMAKAAEIKPTLGLPKGWSFANRTLTRPMKVVATGKATVITDGVKNTYQLR
jgi:hypothetical protein